MTVYADVLFLVNWSLDFVSLYITGRLMSLCMGGFRMSMASLFGAVFAVSALIFDMKGIIYILSSAAVSALMCVIAYKRAGIFTCVGASVLLFSVGSALGGAMTAICSLGDGYSASLKNSKNEAVGLLTVVSFAAIAAVFFGANTAKRRRFITKQKVTVTGLGRSKTILALSDSGSFLSDPVSGRPALIVRADSMTDVIPDRILSAARSEDIAEALTKLPAELLCRVRLLPTEGVLGEGMLLGYRPDSVTVGEGRTARLVDCILAVSDSENGFSGCDALLPSGVLF